MENYIQFKMLKIQFETQSVKTNCLQAIRVNKLFGQTGKQPNSEKMKKPNRSNLTFKTKIAYRQKLA